LQMVDVQLAKVSRKINLSIFRVKLINFRIFRSIYKTSILS